MGHHRATGPLVMGFIRDKRIRNTLIACVLSLKAGSGSAFDLGYGGRLTHSEGAPLSGPVDITVRFYDAPLDGSLLATLPVVKDVPLQEGVFQITLSLTGAQISTIFRDGSQATYIEIEARGQIYPRQAFSYVPYALRVPVDGRSIGYDSEGRLTVLSINPSQVYALSDDLARKASLEDLNEALTVIGNTPVGISGDVTGDSQASTVTKVQGIELPKPGPAENSRYLQYNHATQKYVWSSPSAGGGGLTGVSADPPLLVLNGFSAPQISIFRSTETQNGYLSAQDWQTFNTKQNSLNSSSTLDVASLSTVRQDALVLKPYGNFGGSTGEIRFQDLSHSGTNYVGFKAPDSLNSSIIWTLPSSPGVSGSILSTNGSGALTWVPAVFDGTQINSGSVSSLTIQDGSIANVDISPSAAISTSKLQGPVTDIPDHGLSPLATMANIGTEYIADNAVTEPKIASQSVTTTKLGDLAVPTAKLSNGAVTTAKLDALAVVTSNLDNGAVTTAKLADGAVTTAKIIGSAVTADKIATGVIDNTHISPFANISDTKLAIISSPGKVLNSATSATNLNTASSIVARDGSGNFAAGTITATSFVGSLSGNATNVTGTVAIANGGTGLASSPGNGQLLIGNGSSYALGTLSGGTRIDIVNGPGTVTINSLEDTSKVSKAGDTMTGTLNLPSDGLVVGTSQFIVSGSKVGVGTSNPSLPLTVSGSWGAPATTGTAQTGAFRIQSSGATNSVLDFGGYNSGSALSTWLQSSDRTNLGNNFPLILQPKGGNVGIGIGSDAPATKLDVATSGAGIQSVLRLQNTVTATTNSGAQTLFAARRSNGTVTDVAAVGGLITDTTDGAYKGAIIVSTADGAAPAERIRVIANGNVGIGSNVPRSQLDLEDILGLSGNGSQGSSGATITLGGRWRTDATDTRPFGGVRGFKSHTDGNAGGGLQLLYAPAGSTTLTPALTLAHTGNIGIGTTDPQGALDVSGTVRASVLQSDTLNGAYHTNAPCLKTTDGACFTVYYDAAASGGNRLAFYANKGSLIKTFIIDHPTDPARYLIHSAIEGPEHGAVYYRGEARLKGGVARIELPSYFEALTRKTGRTVLLTCKNGWSPLYYEDIKDGTFHVRLDRKSGLGDESQEFSWEVKAERQGQGIYVEPLKKDIEVHGDGPYKYYSPKH